MAFTQGKSAHDHRALIEKFLKNREILKRRIIDEKIGKQRFQEDVAQPLQQPIKAELDKQQDKLIEITSSSRCFDTYTGRHPQRYRHPTISHCSHSTSTIITCVANHTKSTTATAFPAIAEATASPRASPKAPQ